MKPLRKTLKEIYADRRPTPLAELRLGDLIVNTEYSRRYGMIPVLYRVRSVDKRHVLVEKYDGDTFEVVNKNARLPLYTESRRRVHKEGHGHSGSDYFTVVDRHDAVYDVVPEEFLETLREKLK